jgi:hypothetical protein
MSSQHDVRSDPAGRDSPARTPGAPGHAEWLIDESIAETFPASDAPSPVRPGSTAAMHYSDARYSVAALARAKARALTSSTPFWAVLCISILIVTIFVQRRSP